MSRAGRDAGRGNRAVGAPVTHSPVGDLQVIDVPATTFAPRAMVLELVATLVGCTLAGAAVGLWLHSIDNDFGWSHGEVANVLACAGIGLLVGLAAGVLTAIVSAWTAIMLRRQFAHGRRRARPVMMAATLVLWAAGVWLLLAGFGVGAATWFGWLLMLPALLGALLVVWCGVPWVLRAPGRP